MTCALDGGGQSSLVTGTGAGHTAGKDLCALGSILAELSNILIVDGFSLLYAEAANLSAALAVSAHRTLGAFGTLRSLGALGSFGLCLGGSSGLGSFNSLGLNDVLVFHLYSVLTL